MRHAFRCGGEPRRLAKADMCGTDIDAQDAIGAKTLVVTKGTAMRVVSQIADRATAGAARTGVWPSAGQTAGQTT